MTAQQKAALERLLATASRGTDQSRHVADFLLAWWNAGDCGGFDLTAMWACDTAIIDDIATVFAYVGHNRDYPDELGYCAQFKAMVRNWRPALVRS